MELAAWTMVASCGQGLALLWVPRFQTEEADTLGNGHFAGFDMAKLSQVVPGSMPRKALPSMVVYGTDLQARVVAAKVVVISSVITKKCGGALGQLL